MKYSSAFFIFTLLSVMSCLRQGEKDPSASDEYAGRPYSDTVRALALQTIPGRMECEFFDVGGDSVSYFDTDLNNNGSGSLNQGEGYLMNFRISEAPDISFTKFHDSIDNSKYNIVQPGENQLYLGWTEPGEWTKYTAEVRETGDYQIGAMYTSNRGGAVQIIIDDTDSSGFLSIKSTFHPDDPIGWRQWHHWNYSDSLAVMHIEKGKRVFTLVIEEEGNFNFDYLSFTLL